jgi:polar amino acid transport system substrate-binding protein
MRIKKLMLALCTVLTITTGIQAQDRLVIGTGLKPPLVSSEKSPGFLVQLAKEAFNRIGMRVEIIILPAERVLINANDRVEDGCLLRIRGLEKYYPNLVRVPEKMMNSEFVGYSKLKGLTGGNWDLLTPYAVAWVNGWKIFDNHLGNHPSVTKVKSASQLFLLLKKKRTDIVLYERWQGLWVLNSLQIEDVVQLDPPFVKMEMFMYLHKRHQKTVPILAAALADMKKDGTYQDYYERYLTALENK